jgi:hypothetical protein
MNHERIGCYKRGKQKQKSHAKRASATAVTKLAKVLGRLKSTERAELS